MKKILVVVFAVVVMLGAAQVNAQVPHVAVFFSNGSQAADCPAGPPGTVLDQISIVAVNFDMWMNGIEFLIDYSPAMQWLGDVDDPSRLKIGSTPLGIGVTFPIPLNAFVPAVVMQSNFLWMCDNCGPYQNSPVTVLPYPASGVIRAVRWPDLAIVHGVGLTALVCPTIPVQETTWGGIKAQYND
jgi:hypothetical protein